MAEELSEQIKEAVEHAEHKASGLGNTVAILVALAATFVALVSVKDRNITLRILVHRGPEDRRGRGGRE